MSTKMSTDTTAAPGRDGDLGADRSEVVTLDQASGAVFARYPVATATQVDDAVAVARTAAGRWWELGCAGRARRLSAWRLESARGGEELAALIHAENGKSLEDSRTEVLGAIG